MEKSTRLRMLLVYHQQGLFLSVYSNIDPMWNVLMKDFDLVEHSTRMKNKQRYFRQLQRFV